MQKQPFHHPVVPSSCLETAVIGSGRPAGALAGDNDHARLANLPKSSREQKRTRVFPGRFRLSAREGNRGRPGGCAKGRRPEADTVCRRHLDVRRLQTLPLGRLACGRRRVPSSPPPSLTVCQFWTTDRNPDHLSLCPPTNLICVIFFLVIK